MKNENRNGALFDILKRLTRLTGIVDTFPELVDFLLKRLTIFLQISIYFRIFAIESQEL